MMRKEPDPVSQDKGGWQNESGRSVILVGAACLAAQVPSFSTYYLLLSAELRHGELNDLLIFRTYCILMIIIIA